MISSRGRPTFATTVRDSKSLAKFNSSSWLEKFKQKNNLPEAKSRKGLEANDLDGGLKSSPNCPPGSQTPSSFPPISLTNVTSPTFVSLTRSQVGIKSEETENLLNTANGHAHAHSLNTTSLASFFSDNTAKSSFSAGPTSLKSSQMLYPQ